MEEIFQLADELGPAKVIHVHEPGMGLKGILVADNAAPGPSIGELRMAPDVSPGMRAPRPRHDPEERCRRPAPLGQHHRGAGLDLHRHRPLGAALERAQRPGNNRQRIRALGTGPCHRASRGGHASVAPAA